MLKKMMAFKIAFALWLGFALCHAGTSVAAPSTALSESDGSKTVDGMWAALMAIHSGRGKGHCGRDYGPSELRSSEYAFSFDFDAGRARIERTFPAARRTLIRIDSPQETVFSLAGSRAAQREPPLTGAPVDGLDPFDVRIIALISFGEFAISNEDTTCRTFSRLRQHLNELGTPRVSAVGRGAYCIAWGGVRATDREMSTPDTQYQFYRRIAFVDPSEGFVPTRTEIWMGFGPTRDVEGTLYAVTTARWGIVDDIRVPIECTYDIVDSPKHANLRLHWKSVGGSIQPNVFTIEGLDLPSGAVVIDKRLGATIIDSVIGATPPNPGVAGSNSPIRLVWTLVSLVALACVLIACALRLRKGTSHAP